MKSEAEKIKTQANIGASDLDWGIVKKAVAIRSIPLSQFLREAVVKEAKKVVAKGGGK